MPIVKTKDINTLAVDLIEGGVRDIRETTNPKVAQFMNMLHDYANNLFHRTLRTDNEEDRKDLSQEACLRAIKYFKCFNPQRSQYSTYFFSICKGVHSTLHQNKTSFKRRPESGKIVSLNQALESKWVESIGDKRAMTPIMALLDKEERDIQETVINRLLGKHSPLTPTQKETFVVVSQGNNLRQAGEILGCSHENVRQAMGKVIKYARKLTTPIFTPEEKKFLHQGISDVDNSFPQKFYRQILENRLFNFERPKTHAAALGITYHVYKARTAYALGHLQHTLEQQLEPHVLAELQPKLDSLRKKRTQDEISRG